MKKFTKIIAIAAAGVMAVTALAATASATSEEINDVIDAIKSNPNLQGAWEAAYSDPENEHDYDMCALDILNKIGIDTTFGCGYYENEYEDGDYCISHEEVIESIGNVKSEDTGSWHFGSPKTKVRTMTHPKSFIKYRF